MASAQKTLKVAVLGPSGQCGQCVVDELLSRGHNVVGISRNPPKTWGTDIKTGSYSAQSVDLHDTPSLVRAFSDGFDAIVCAFAPPLSDMASLYEKGVEGHAAIKTALLASDHSGSFLIIGGAGSLHCADRRQLVDQDEFCYSWWYTWPDDHLRYMRVRMDDHGATFFSLFIRGFAHARGHIENPGSFSFLFRPFARLYLWWAKRFLMQHQPRALIMLSRMALAMWEGVREKRWTFLSPPGQLRDKGLRTGEYKLFLDSPEEPAVEAVEQGIYNEDLAVAIVDEVENNRLTHKHWSVVGPIGLKEW